MTIFEHQTMPSLSGAVQHPLDGIKTLRQS
jgi:hypothetical protein